MEESNMQLLADTDSSATAQAREEERDEAFGAFVALRRLEKVSVEAVRMQGCVGGGGGSGSGGTSC